MPSRFEQQRQRGFSRLIFDSVLEQQYRESQMDASSRLPRLAAVVGCAPFVAFAALDLFALPLEISGWTAALRLFVVCPCLLFAGYADRWARTPTQRARGVLAAYLTAAIAIVALVHAAAVFGGVRPRYEGLVLLSAYAFLFSGLPWRWTCVWALATTAIYTASYLALSLPAATLINNLIALFSVMSICAMGGYLLEHGRRDFFLKSESLRELSEQDCLTGLCNHRVFFERCDALLGQARRDGKRLAVMLVDADHFKRFNDSLGHLAGDETLRRIADCLRLWVRRPMDVAARLGGEEFALLWYDAPRDWTCDRVEELRAAVENLRIVHPQAAARWVTVSIGVAFSVPGQYASAEALLGQADQALYRAKGRGRNRVEVCRE